MDLLQWAATGSFLLSVGTTIFVVTWGAGKIKQDISDRIADEVLAREQALSDAAAARNAEMEKMRRDLHESQMAQDHDIGEMGHALRATIEKLKDYVHEIELFGARNYVRIPDFDRAVERLSSEIKATGTELKADIKSLIGNGHQN